MSDYPEKIINKIVTRNKLSFSIINESPIDFREFRCTNSDDDDDDVGGMPFTHLQKLNFPHTRNKIARPSFRKPIDVDSRFGTTDASSVSKEIATSFDDDEGFSDPICPTDKMKIFPKTLPNLLNELVVVVNHGKFRQEVTIERCKYV